MMMPIRKWMLAVPALTFVMPAHAQDKVLQPVQVDEERIVYRNSVPSLERHRERGMIRITPDQFDGKTLSFWLVAFNMSDQKARFDLANVHITIDGKPVAPLSYSQLAARAERKAGWEKVGVAIAGGLAAWASASSRDTYTARAYTPRGTYTTTISTPSVSGQIAANSISIATGYTIAQMDRRLSQKLSEIGNTVLQFETVEPGDLYGGQVILPKYKFPKAPSEVRIVVDWNGETYRFGFKVVDFGAPAPMWQDPHPEPSPPPPLQDQKPKLVGDK